MTGDSVGDAPVLDLADVGVVTGHSGTEVARRNSDIVLVNDDCSILMEAFVERRSFWRNIRCAVTLILGGNLGELGLIAGASVVELASPSHRPPVFLTVNLITWLQRVLLILSPA